MKEFLKTNTITYNLISFTGFKALIIFSLLLESPKSYDEIIDYFANHDYIKETISIDTIRVYLNSLKRIGCVITKTKRCEGSKYVLVSHPFELTIAPEQIKSISKIYKTISRTIDIDELILLKKFFRKIASYIKNPEFTETFSKISILTGLDIEMLENLLQCCNKKQQIVLNYNSPRSGHKEIEIVCDKLGFENNKLYIYGNCLDYSDYGYFLVSRIIDIKEIKNNSKNFDTEEIVVKYELLANQQEIQLNDDEKLLEVNNNKVLIELKSSNKFRLKQRILSLGSTCKVIEPEEFKQEIIETLKRMRQEY